jgi:hypothetical protein
MIENPYKRGPALPPKKPSRLALPCSLRSIILIFILLLAALTFYLHGRGSDTQSTDEAKGIPAGKLRGARDKTIVDKAADLSKRRKSDPVDKTKDVVPTRLPVVSKRAVTKAKSPTARPTATPTSSRPTVRPTTEPTRHPVRTAEIPVTSQSDSRKSKELPTVKLASGKKHVEPNGQTTPVVVSGVASRGTVADSKTVKIVIGHSKKESNVIQEKRTEPADASKTVKIVIGQHKIESIRGPEQETRAESFVNGTTVKIAMTKKGSSIGQEHEQRAESVGDNTTAEVEIDQPKKESIGQKREVRAEPAQNSTTVKVAADQPMKESIRGQEQEERAEPSAEAVAEKEEEEVSAVRGQEQGPEGDVEGNALRDKLRAEEKEAAKEAGREVVHSREQEREEVSRGGVGGQQESGSADAAAADTADTADTAAAASAADADEVRAKREASLKHSQLREEPREDTGSKAPALPPKAIPPSTPVREGEEQEQEQGAKEAPAQPPKEDTGTTSSNSGSSSSSKASGSTKSQTKSKSKAKEVKPKVKNTTPLTPAAAKLAAAKAAMALVDPADLLDIEGLTPVEVADGGNHEQNTLGPQLLGVGVVKGPVAVDCSGSMDPFPGQAVETYEPPVQADLKAKMEWGDAVRDMLARIRQMKMGGEPLRKAIREEVNALVVLRVKLFCEYAVAAAAAVPVEMKSKSQESKEGS